LRFWDASGVVPIFVEERARTSFCRKLLRKDDRMVVWAFTRTECCSALARRRREGMLELDYARALQQLDAFAAGWREVKDLVLVRGHAERFLQLYPLRAGDALQLGAAWVYASGAPKGREFVALDGPLAAAARAEGFTVLALT
jgi:uncharacterized protein with PIN domain